MGHINCITRQKNKGFIDKIHYDTGLNDQAVEIIATWNGMKIYTKGCLDIIESHGN